MPQFPTTPRARLGKRARRAALALGAAFVAWLDVPDPVPGSPALSGLTVYGQFAVFEGPSAVPPVTMTNAVRMTLGPRPPVVFDTVANLDGSATGAKFPDHRTVSVTRLMLE